MIKLYLSEPEIFKEEFEPNLCSGSYLWIDNNYILYNVNRYDIFDHDLDFDELMEVMTIELIVI
jgi:hypothetical protein